MDPKPIKFKWDKSKEQNFVGTLAKQDWVSLDNIFSERDVKIDTIDKVADNISQNLFSAAKVCMKITRNSRVRDRKTMHKPWYSHDCEKLKRRLNNLSKLVTKLLRDPIIRGNFVTAKKNYRKLVKSCKFMFQQRAINKLTGLANNPREFWMYIDKLMGKSKSAECLVSDKEWGIRNTLQP